MNEAERTERIAYGMDRYSWNQGYNALYDFQVFENVEPALVARGGAAVCCYGKKRPAVVSEGDRQPKCHGL